MLPEAHGGPIEDLYYGIRNGTTPVLELPRRGHAAHRLRAVRPPGAARRRRREGGVGRREDGVHQRARAERVVGRTYRPGWEM